MDAFLDSLPAEAGVAASWDSPLLRQNEAVLVPTQVNYVCKAANLYEDAGYEVRVVHTMCVTPGAAAGPVQQPGYCCLCGSRGRGSRGSQH